MSENTTKSGRSRGEWACKPFARAWCETCGWQCQERNAHGAGVQHSRRHKHCVVIEVERTLVYNNEES